MNYTIVEKPAFRVIGKPLRVSTKNGENIRRIPQFWDECMSDGTYEQLTRTVKDDNVLGDVTLGICTDFTANMEEFTYMIAAVGTPGDVPEGMVEKAVPALMWAVFDVTGPMPEAIQNVWGEIFSEFFETSGYHHGAGPDLELYPPGDASSSDYSSQVWVPVEAN